MSLISNVLSKLFGGNKYEKDIKAIMPLVEQIKVEYAKLEKISNDELRNKTPEFRRRIKDHLKENLKLHVEAAQNTFYIEKLSILFDIIKEKL